MEAERIHVETVEKYGNCIGHAVSVYIQYVEKWGVIKRCIFANMFLWVGNSYTLYCPVPVNLLKLASQGKPFLRD